MSELLITEMLAEKFASPAWAFLPQVRSATGYQNKVRTVDALAFSLYPSRGLDLHGFEIKTSRADLKKELEEPDKADMIGKYCDYWWLAIPNVKAIHNLVLPGAWGIILCDKKAVIEKQAKKQEDVKPLGRLQLAAIMRKVQQTAGWEAEINQRVKDQRQKTWEEGYKAGQETNRQQQQQHERLIKQVGELKLKTGIDLTNNARNDYKSICDALKFIRKTEEDGQSIFQLFGYIGKMGQDLARKSDLILEEVEKFIAAKPKKVSKSEDGELFGKDC